jgi:hypothetical protein
MYGTSPLLYKSVIFLKKKYEHPKFLKKLKKSPLLPSSLRKIISFKAAIYLLLT